MADFDTQISIGGNDFVTDRETALKLYDLLAHNVMGFAEYSQTPLSPLVGYSLQLSPLGADFNDDIAAAKVLGEKFSEYKRNKQVKSN